MGHALPQGFRIRIVQSAYLWGHAGGEHMVDTLDDLSAGAEIVAEQHFPPLPRLRMIGTDVGSVLFKKDTRVS